VTRWRARATVSEQSGLTRGRELLSPHPASPSPHAGDAPAYARLVVRAPTGRIVDESLPTSSVRAEVLRTLRGPAVRAFLASVGVDTGLAWSSYGRSRHEHHAAVLIGDDPAALPAAWASIEVPSTESGPWGGDPDAADLVVHADIAVHSDLGGSGVSRARDLVGWHGIFTACLAVPDAVTGLLRDGLALGRVHDPPVRAHLWARAPHRLNELVDWSAHASVPGNDPPPWFGFFASQTRRVSTPPRPPPSGPGNWRTSSRSTTMRPTSAASRLDVPAATAVGQNAEPPAGLQWVRRTTGRATDESSWPAATGGSGALSPRPSKIIPNGSWVGLAPGGAERWSASYVHAPGRTGRLEA